MTAASTGPIVPDYAMVNGRQKAAWSSGNYAVVGTTLQIVGEMLCEAVDLRSGENVLDVAAGNGNATLAAARRFAKVTSTDYVGALLDLGSERAKAERLDIAFQQADAENLPYEASSFDVVLSTFGVMFTPDHRRAATELLRVCRPGGRIGLANWTPASFIGNVFRTIGKYVPPPAGVVSPAQWGTPDHLAALFGSNATIAATERNFNFRYVSPSHFVEIFRTYYGPVLKAFAALDDAGAAALERDLRALIDDFNIATDGTVVIPSAYLEVVARRR
jgi:SAM-dependent methyltransferase